MKAAVLYDDKMIEPQNASDPQIGPNEVLLASGTAGICGTDLHVYRGEFKARVAYPAILGHEFGGVIEEVGKDVQGYKRGDRVVVDPIMSCHHCEACLTGHINACSTLKLLGIDSFECRCSQSRDADAEGWLWLFMSEPKISSLEFSQKVKHLLEEDRDEVDVEVAPVPPDVLPQGDTIDVV